MSVLNKDRKKFQSLFLVDIALSIILLLMGTDLLLTPYFQKSYFQNTVSVNSGKANYCQFKSRPSFDIPSNLWSKGNTTEGCRINNNVINNSERETESSKHKEISQWNINLGQVRISSIFGLSLYYTSFRSNNHSGKTSLPTPLRL